MPEYVVGYGRPPREKRFQPGQSGNPAGRPRAHRNLRTDLQEELAVVEVIEGPDGQEEIPRQRLIMRRLIERAMRSDPKAVALLVSLQLKLLDQEDDDSDFSGTDEAIVDGFIEQELARRKPMVPKSPKLSET